jgi:NAD(P)-dependent dehydrogenase (short-subunit alcohol dehydrogenase family)
MSWTIEDIPDLAGRRALVTGVTGGLGEETALGLARHGADVVVTARDAAKAAPVLERLRAQARGDVDLVDLDLADLGSVQRAADSLLNSHDRLDILVNNAGVMAPPKRRTTDGFELQIGTNHLGHFALTGRLWPLLRNSYARVVFVSSIAHRMAKGIDLRSLEPGGDPRAYQRWRSYGESKLANLMTALELGERAANTGVVSVAAHPGYAATDLQRTGPELEGGPTVQSRAMMLLNQVVAQPATAGAWPLLLAASLPGLASGAYLGPSGIGEVRGEPTLVGTSAAARDRSARAALWAASEVATGVSFP